MVLPPLSGEQVVPESAVARIVVGPVRGAPTVSACLTYPAVGDRQT